MPDHAQVLQEVFRISPREAAAYLALLRHGDSTTQRVSELTGINRVSLYSILDGLVHKGLAAAFSRGGIKHFAAAPPKELAAQIRKDERLLSSILQELEAARAERTDRPRVQVFEGDDAIERLNTEVLENAREIRAYGPYDIMQELPGWQTLEFLKRRLDRKIAWRSITTRRSTPPVAARALGYAELTEVRIDPSLRSLRTWTYLYGSKVATLSFRQGTVFAVVVADDSIAATHAALFERMWQGAIASRTYTSAARTRRHG